MEYLLQKIVVSKIYEDAFQKLTWRALLHMAKALPVIVAIGAVMAPSVTYAEGPNNITSTTEIFVPGVGGTLFNGSLVHATDVHSGEDFGTKETIMSLATFDTITDVASETIMRYGNIGVWNDKLLFGTKESGKVLLIAYDILAQQGNNKIEYESHGPGNQEINIQKLLPSHWASGNYPIMVKTPTMRYTFTINAVEGNYHSSSSPSVMYIGRTSKVNEDQVRIVVSGDDHYTRTFVSDKNPRIEDYVVEYVEQMKTDGTPVTEEEFKQYCFDFNFSYLDNGLKSFFPNPDKQIWIASKGPPGGEQYTFTQEQMESIRDLVIDEIYPYIEAGNQPSFYLDDPNNPGTPPLHETGKIVIFPIEAGYVFGTGIDNETGVIKYGTIGLYYDLDIANNWGRKETLEEVASCFMGPRGTQGPPYVLIRTIFNAGTKMHPIDIKLFEMGQKYQPKVPLDDVLGL